MSTAVQRTMVSLLFLVVSLLLLPACAPIAQRNKPPVAYNQICQPRAEQPNSRSGVNDASAEKKSKTDGTTDSIDARTSPDPGWYLDGSKAQDIAQARVRVMHVREAYEAFECREEISNRNNYDRPLIATAIAATAAALAKANPYVIGGIGLTAGGIATFKSYNHPDADRDAFLTAYAQLTCVYDETHSLALNVESDKMIYDRDALQIQLDIVTDDIAPLTGDQSTLTPQEKAVLAAANIAITAGNKAIDATNGELTAYNGISTVIYKTVDGIDITARTANKTVGGTLASYMSSIKDAYTAVGQSKASANDAKKTTDAADAAQNSAGFVPATAPGKKASLTYADKRKAAAVKKLTTGQSKTPSAGGQATAPAAATPDQSTLPAVVTSLTFRSSCKPGTRQQF